MSSDLAEHLRFFQQLGVTGVSRDAVWRVRPSGGSPPAATSVPPAEPAPVSQILHTPPAATVTSVPGAASGRGTTARSQTVPMLDARGLLRVLQDEIGPQCGRCKLHTLGRKQVVFGVGNPSADLMFVGEAPGADEDEQGEPFVGRAGQLLTKIIEAIGLRRDQVYIANLIKCRPPGNRNPEPDEVEQCEPFLLRQVDAIKPRVIVALGKFSAQALLKTGDPITRLRGRVFNYRGASLIPTFHPAYLLRNPSAKRDVWDDMKKARAILQGDE